MIKLLGEKTSKNEIEAVVKEADNNGDGTVDFEGEVQRCANTQIFKKEKENIFCFILNVAKCQFIFGVNYNADSHITLLTYPCKSQEWLI